MANLPKQHRSVYEKSFNLKHVLKNLQGYKLASGDVHPSELREVREIFGDDEGKVYGSLISQEAGSSNWERQRSVEQEKRQRRRKRNKRGSHKNLKKATRIDSTISSGTSISSTVPPENALSPSGESPLPPDVGGTSPSIQEQCCSAIASSSSLKLLSSAYSSDSSSASSGASGDETNEVERQPKLVIPDSIQSMFQPSRTSKVHQEVSAGDESSFLLSDSHIHANDDDDGDSSESEGNLGYFEPAVDSDESDSNGSEPSFTEREGKSLVPSNSHQLFSPPSLKEWDSEKGKFVFSSSPLSTYVCWKCSKVGHLPSDCTVAVKDGGGRKAQRETLKIPSELKSLYSKCRELQRRKSDHCAECGVHSNLACCLECGAIYCDGCGHLSSHLLSHPSHSQLYSYKLTRMLKCCKATCPVVSVYDLLVCSHCLSKAFSQHYSMVNATWSRKGLRVIPNALCCEDHFDWHRTNCPSVGDERLLMASSLRSKDDGLAVKQISEFLF